MGICIVKASTAVAIGRLAELAGIVGSHPFHRARTFETWSPMNGAVLRIWPPSALVSQAPMAESGGAPACAKEHIMDSLSKTSERLDEVITPGTRGERNGDLQ